MRGRLDSDLMPGHFQPEQRNVLRAVALAYRRIARNRDPSVTLAASEGQAVDAAIGEYRRASPYDTRTDLEISGEVLRMIAAAINADARWFWHGPDV
jgi:hypothetical protein